MNGIFPSDPTEFIEIEQVYVGFENEVDTLQMGNVEISFDFQLGDEDLEVSLLVESLEEQYKDLISSQVGEHLDVQSAKEWINCYKDKMAGLFRYLKHLTSDDLAGHA